VATAALAGALCLTPGLANAAPGDQVVVPDPAFRACLSAKTGGAALTPASLGAITGDLACYGVGNLTGVAHLTNVESLTLNGSFTDVRALSNLSSAKLKTLNLSNGFLTALPKLPKLTGLVELDVSGNHLTSVPDLGQWPMLKYAYLASNDISSASSSALRSASLIELDLGRNRLKSVPSIAKLTSLEAVYFYNNLISSASASALRSSTLAELNLAWNKLTALPDFSGLPNVGDIEIGYNRISDLSAFERYAANSTEGGAYVWANNQVVALPAAQVGRPYSVKLRGGNGEYMLSMGDTPFQGFDEWRHDSPLPAVNTATHQVTYSTPGTYAMKFSESVFEPSQNPANPSYPEGGVEIFYDAWVIQVALASGRAASIPDPQLQYCLLDDLDGRPMTSDILASITGEFNCGNRGVADVSGVQYLTGITGLDLYRNNLINVSALASLRSVNLTTVTLDDNKLTSLPGLSRLTSLTYLDATDNSIKSVPSLSSWKSLTHLNLSENVITSVSSSALRSNTLKHLDLRSNPLKSAVPTSRVPNLETLLVS
jgi:Leucine-rich repeat (LRR) protein